MTEAGYLRGKESQAAKKTDNKQQKKNDMRE